MPPPSLASTIELEPDELLCLRLALELYGDSHCPFVALKAVPADRLEQATRSLVQRGLVDKKGFRPDRDLTRRLLVVSEPDARIVLMAAGPGGVQPLVDLYTRTGVFVQHAGLGRSHSLGPVLEAAEIFQDLQRRFSPRSATGDFIDLQLDGPQHFAFMCFAQALSLGGASAGVLSGDVPTAPFQATLDGVVLGADKKLPASSTMLVPEAPEDEDWREALQGLLQMDVIRKAQDGFRLKPYLRDLAIGLVQDTRHVLTRFDYRDKGWVARDATFVAVPGSLFSMRGQAEGGLRVRELRSKDLGETLHEVIDD